MPIAVTAEHLALQDALRTWATDTEPRRAVRDMEPPADPRAGPAPGHRHWTELAELGVFGIGLPESVGGAGGDACDVVAALEQLTDALVAGPVMPTLLAGLLLAPHQDRRAVRALLPQLTAGRASVAVAFDLGTTRGAAAPGGGLRVTGRLGPVLGAGATTHLLLGAATDTGQAWFLLPAGHPQVRLTPRTPVDFSRPLADIELMDLTIGPDEVVVDGAAAGPRVRDTAALLAAVEAAAVAAWCLHTATGYAKVRRQFGQPVGSFQAVKHLCAGMLCRAERATALAWDAARALAERPGEFPFAAAAAAAVALEAGVDNAKDCIQVLGGIGFTWEHDAHLYLRRAVALRQLLGDPAHWRARVADLALAGARRTLHPGTGPDRANDSARDDPARDDPARDDPARDGGVGDRLAVRATLARIATLPTGQQRAALTDAGLLAPEWPAPYGRGATPAQQIMIDEELGRAGLTRPELAIAGWAVPTIVRHGSDAQRGRFVGPSLRGEIVWCQLFSEPEAGSDLAALRTRAHRVPGGWRLTGQKVWTSLAAQAHWAICLARTDPAAPKHRGIGYFLVAMDSPGIDIRPLREITGRAVFNEVFLDDVFVADDCLVGAPGDGWRLARGTLEHERVAMGRGSSLGDGVEQLVTAVRDGDLAGRPGVADRLGGLVADGLAVSVLDLRATLRRLDGHQGATEAAVAKLVGVGQRQAVAEAGLLWCGPDGAAADHAAAEPVHQFLLSRCLSIAGGTTQILLTVAAERVLGLPRPEAR